MSNNMKDAIERMRELADGAFPEKGNYGLCREMSPYPIMVSNLALGWAKHSGSECYPIPASSHGYSAIDEYSRNMDLWRGEQGRLRRELCSYIADKLEKAVDKL